MYSTFHFKTFHLLPSPILSLCDRLSLVTYENLTKILRFARTGSAEGAHRLDDSHQNNMDHWMGGGTCFSITWHLYQELQLLGYKPRLLMGHKRKERNVHCALSLQLPQNPQTPWNELTLFFDPGYLIFDPLPIPHSLQNAVFPLRPNLVELRRAQGDVLELWTGSFQQPPKLRFEFPLAGVDEAEFHQHWKASFHLEMMRYPVLNRLDREQGVQYYYQKGNLVIRNSEGSRMVRIEGAEQVQVLSETFRLDPAMVEDALGMLRHST